MQHYFRLRSFAILNRRNPEIERISRISGFLTNWSVLEMRGFVSSANLQAILQPVVDPWILNPFLSNSHRILNRLPQQVLHFANLEARRPEIVSDIDEMLSNFRPPFSEEPVYFESPSRIRNSEHLHTLGGIVEFFQDFDNNLGGERNADWISLLAAKWPLLLKNSEIAIYFYKTLELLEEYGLLFLDNVIPHLLRQLDSIFAIHNGIKILRRENLKDSTEISIVIQSGSSLHSCLVILSFHQLINPSNERLLFLNARQADFILTTLRSLHSTASLSQNTFNSMIEMREYLQGYISELMILGKKTSLKIEVFNELLSTFLKE